MIRQRLLDNRATGNRGDVTDEVVAAHRESFEPPEVDEQAVRLQVGSSPLDLDGVCKVVRESFGQPR